AGWILYVQQPRIMRVAESGGEPSVLLDVGQRVVGPSLLPDGDSLLFTIGSERSRRVMLRSLSSGKQTVLVDYSNSPPQYLPSGHLVYGSGGDISARAFNLKT